MRKPRQFVLIGAGQVGRALLDDIPLNWTVTVVDIDPQALDALPEHIGGQAIMKLQGDATSRLVLQEIGLTPRSQVAILTGTDDVNREIARLIHGHFQVDDLVCLLDNADDLDAIGLNSSQIAVRSVASARLAMTHFSQSEPHLIADQLARGEIRVFQVLPGSAAVGRSLGSLKPKRWLVGAIYRGEKLLVPHGETIVESGDQVMLIGEADVVESVARYMHGSEAVFPMQYGNAIGVLGTSESATKEGEWLEKKTQADALHTLDKKQFNPKRNSAEAIARDLAQQEIGLLILDNQPVGLGVRLGLQRSKRHDFVLSGRIPVLIARSNRKYQRILVAVSTPTSLNAISVVGMDIATQVGASLTVLTVLPPTLSKGEEVLKPLREMPKQVRALGRLHGMDVETLVMEGNPIERIRKCAQDFDLLVVGRSHQRENTIFKPDVALHLLHNTPCSVLFVPWNVTGR